MMDWGNFLHRIREEDSEHSTPSTIFFLVWRFSDKQRHLVVASGGRGWWRRRYQGLGGVWRGGESENHVFYIEERIYNLQILLSKLISLSGSPLFALSVIIRAQRNSLFTKSRSAGQFSLSAIPFRVGIALSAPLLAQRNSLSDWNCTQRALHTQRDIKNCYLQNPNGHTVEDCLRKLQPKFEDDPTINELGIAILLKQVQVKFEIS